MSISSHPRGRGRTLTVCIPVSEPALPSIQALDETATQMLFATEPVYAARCLDDLLTAREARVKYFSLCVP